MGIRRRPNHDEDGSAPLDEDEQSKIIEELQSQIDSNYQQIQRMFLGICWSLSVLCLFAALFVQLRHEGSHSPLLFFWIHAAISCYLHFQTPSMVSTRTTSVGSYPQVLPYRLYATLFITSLVLAAVCIGRLRLQSGSTEILQLHQGYVLGNALTLLAALFLRYDMNQAQSEMQELNASKYRFKSL